MFKLSAIDWMVCAVYLGVVFGLAIWSARRQESNEDYFVGGRRMNWPAVGISIFATSFSSISFLGLPQRGAYQDFSFYLTLLCIPLIITPILWFVFIPVFMRLRVTSGYQYLGRRFGLSAQRIGSVLYCLYALGWMGTMLHAVALTLQTVLGLDQSGYLLMLLGVGLFATIYTAVGGFKAVVWTDVAQVVVLGGAILLVLVLAVNGVQGGWSGFWEIASEQGKFKMIHLEEPFFAKENFTRANSVFTALAFGLFMYLPGYAVSQNMIQRYVSAGTLARGRGVILLNAVINTVLGFFFLLLGAALFAFYTQQGGPGLPQAGAELTSQDQILPYFVAKQLPGIGLVGLILAGLFAAAMSSVDSGINGMTSVIVYDWMSGRELPVRTSRAVTVVLGVVVIGAALLAPQLGTNVIDIIMTIAGTMLGILLAVYLLGILLPHANWPGVRIGLVAGVVSLALVIIFTDVPKWWLGAFTIFPTFFVGAVSSFFYPSPERAALQGTLLKATSIHS
jgi:solute:Na+ symporter, SSS family